MTPLEALRDTLARIVIICEALELGDIGYAYAVGKDLEHDLAGSIERLQGEEKAA